jgi:hypothetical protein
MGSSGLGARTRTLGVFLLSGALAGTGLGLLLWNEDLQSVWFEKGDIWLVPRCPYWAAHGVALLAGLFLASVIDPTLRRTARRIPHPALRLLASGALIAGSIPLVGCGLTFIVSLISEEGFGFGPYFLGAPLVALLISLGLFLVTRKWYTLIVIVLAVVALVGRPVARLVGGPLQLLNSEVTPSK